jgi:hypothetical protein
MPFKILFTFTILIVLIQLLRFVNGQVATGGQSDRTQQGVFLIYFQ